MAEHIYDPTQIEHKWQAWWNEHGTNAIDLETATDPYYVLMMFPYPSAEGLHVGNVYAFTGADIHARYMRLRGKDVFEPIGFDAFGIHSENFAMKVNRHPRELIPANIENFTRQLTMMGLMFDWDRTVDTTTPEYYKWTQWVFLQLYKAGLVYRDTKEVNFCPQCGTVISDEQVNTDGTCERHSDTMVERRAMPCWFFRITKFADRLVENHLNNTIDWSQKTKLAQLGWIGRSEGAEVNFSVPVGEDTHTITVFTTRPDTLFGATFMVLSPEHPLVDQIASPDQRDAIAAYRKECAAKSEEERTADDKEKTGVNIGAVAINPVNGEKIPIFIADYVLMGYGTGAIMAVPCGDHRDFAFAKKFNLPVNAIIEPNMDKFEKAMVSGIDIDPDSKGDGVKDAVLAGNAAWSGPGKIINSSNAEINLNGMEKEDAVKAITKWLDEKNLGNPKKQFRLRDWGISRQRYWGPPIPVWYDEDGNHHPIPEDQLPVTLPDMDDFRPKGDGKGPLAGDPEWMAVEFDGKKGVRETDVMDNFLDSAWYFLRYVSSNDPTQAYDPKLIKKWLPVDMYIGGNEHAVLHLLYTRFICMALNEAGVLDFGDGVADPGEPFKKFRAHGLLVKDGSKMSKSKGNVVNPDKFVEEHGADTLRTYLMFLGPYEQGGDFRDKDIIGIRRFFNRVFESYRNASPTVVEEEQLPKSLRVKMHQTIKKITSDLDSKTQEDPLSYNTSISSLMELHNEMKGTETISRSLQEAFLIMLAPFAPHLTEELWHEALGHETSIFEAKWPGFDEALTVLDEIEVPVQINGKIRERIMVSKDLSKDELEKLVLASDTVQKNLTDGQQVRKVIVVPGRLVNIIIK